MVTIRTFARTAIVAAVIGTTAVSTAALSNAAPKAPWGPAQAIADAFPDLLPTSPSATGYHGASCETNTSPGEESGATVGIECKDTDAVEFAIYGFPTASGVDAALATLELSEAQPGQLDDGSDYTLYSLEDSPEGAVVFLTFEAKNLQKYLLVVGKEGATVDELGETWGHDAPIGTDRA